MSVASRVQFWPFVSCISKNFEVEGHFSVSNIKFGLINDHSVCIPYQFLLDKILAIC